MKEGRSKSWKRLVLFGAWAVFVLGKDEAREDAEKPTGKGEGAGVLKCRAGEADPVEAEGDTTWRRMESDEITKERYHVVKWEFLEMEGMACRRRDDGLEVQSSVATFVVNKETVSKMQSDILEFSCSSVGQEREISKLEDGSISVDGVSKMRINKNSGELVSKLRLWEMQGLREVQMMQNSQEVIERLLETGKEILLGAMQGRVWLDGYSTGVLPRMRVDSGGMIYLLEISGSSREEVCELERVPDESISVEGEISGIRLIEAGMAALTKFRHGAVSSEGGARGRSGHKSFITLHAKKKESVQKLMEREDQSIDVGVISDSSEVSAVGYGVSVLRKLKVAAESNVSFATFSASTVDEVEGVFSCNDGSIFVGRITNRVTLHGYAIELLNKLAFHEDSMVQELIVGTWRHQEKYVAMPQSVLRRKDNSIFVGRVERQIAFFGAGLGLVSKIRGIDEHQVEEMELSAEKDLDVFEMMQRADRSVCVATAAKQISMIGTAVNVYGKLRWPEGKASKVVFFSAWRDREIRGIMSQKDASIFVPKETTEVRLRGKAMLLAKKLDIENSDFGMPDEETEEASQAEEEGML